MHVKYNVNVSIGIPTSYILWLCCENFILTITVYSKLRLTYMFYSVCTCSTLCPLFCFRFGNPTNVEKCYSVFAAYYVKTFNGELPLLLFH